MSDMVLRELDMIQDLAITSVQAVNQMDPSVFLIHLYPLPFIILHCPDPLQQSTYN